MDVADSSQVRLEISKALAGLDDDGFVGSMHHYWVYMRSMSLMDWLKSGWVLFVCGMVGWFVLTAILAIAQEHAATRSDAPTSAGNRREEAVENGMHR